MRCLLLQHQRHPSPATHTHTHIRAGPPPPGSAPRQQPKQPRTSISSSRHHTSLPTPTYDTTSSVDASSGSEDEVDGWCTDLESDLYAVATEAGVSKAASVAIVDAARRGRIPHNPGVLLSQVCVCARMHVCVWSMAIVHAAQRLMSRGCCCHRLVCVCACVCIHAGRCIPHNPGVLLSQVCVFTRARACVCVCVNVCVHTELLGLVVPTTHAY